MARKKKRNKSGSDTTDRQSASPFFTPLPGMAPRPVMKRFAWFFILVSILVAPFVIYGSVGALKVYSNDVMQWLPNGFKEAKEFAWFKQHFGVDEMIVMSWPGCEIDNDDVIIMQRALEARAHEGQQVFSRVISGQSMQANIRAGGASIKAARKRMRGLMIGPDNKTTCVLAFPNEKTGLRRAAQVAVVYDIGQSELGLGYSDIKLGGPTVDGAAIDVESKRSLDQFMWVTVVLVFLLTWFRQRDLPLSIVVLLFSVGCAGLSLSMLYYSGGTMNMTMIMLPTLTFVLGVSGCVHMANYYRKAVNSGHGIDAADITLRDAFWPVFASSMTTAIGLVSLGTSQVAPIRQFGIYSAFGVLLSMPVILFGMPAALHFLKSRIKVKVDESENLSRREVHSGVSRKTSLLMNWVIRYHWWVTIPSILGLVALSIGVSKIKATFKLQNRFADRTAIIQDYQWMETNLGPLVPMEIVVRIGNDTPLTLWEQMDMVDAIETAIERTTAVNASLSAATFRPPVPRGTSALVKARKQIIIKEWTERISDFEEARLYKKTDSEHLWRISLRIAALHDIDYGNFLASVAENVDHQLRHEELPHMSAILTGGIPLFYKAQRQILYDLMKSFLTAFILITIVLMLVLRSFRAGLIAMIPNVFPPLIVFGAMGWMGSKIGIGSVMTASVALGIAVDDTMHFLTWYRRGNNQGLSRFKAIRHAFSYCAKAMIDTTMICGLGVAPFLLSVFMPTVRFSWLMLILLSMALVGDLILLPAILASPAGLLFRKLTRKKAAIKREATAQDIMNQDDME